MYEAANNRISDAIRDGFGLGKLIVGATSLALLVVVVVLELPSDPFCFVSCAIKADEEIERALPIIITDNNFTTFPFKRYNFKGKTTNGGTKKSASHVLRNVIEGRKTCRIWSEIVSLLIVLKSNKLANIPTIAPNDAGKAIASFLKTYTV